MNVLLLCMIPLITYGSLVLFRHLHLTVVNYEGKVIPYNLGMVIFISFALFYLSSSIESKVLTLYSLLFVFGIWVIGLVDDVWGSSYPKGLKGHLNYFIEKGVVTTGLLKVAGTVAISLLVLLTAQFSSIFVAVVAFLLLTSMPHVMNLFDTRPLRVLKVSFGFLMILFLMNPLPSVSVILTLLLVFSMLCVLEGYKKAMLGDNGATVIGAIISLVYIHHAQLWLQVGTLGFALFITALAEKQSISKLIEKWSFLRLIDQIGVMKK